MNTSTNSNESSFSISNDLYTAIRDIIEYSSNIRKRDAYLNKECFNDDEGIKRFKRFVVQFDYDSYIHKNSNGRQDDIFDIAL